MIRTVLIILLCAAFLNLNAQFYNQEYYGEDEAPFLLGPIKKDRLTEGQYGEWFNPYFSAYQVDQEALALIEKSIKEYDLILFLGTWCSDSQREVPGIFKILEAAGYPANTVEIYAVDDREEFKKTTPGGEAQVRNIVRVPTLIFEKDGVEVNRIIELPVQTLEKDIAAILGQQTYTPYYADEKLPD